MGWTPYLTLERWSTISQLDVNVAFVRLFISRDRNNTSATNPDVKCCCIAAGHVLRIIV